MYVMISAPHVKWYNFTISGETLDCFTGWVALSSGGKACKERTRACGQTGGGRRRASSGGSGACRGARSKSQQVKYFVRSLVRSFDIHVQSRDENSSYFSEPGTLLDVYRIDLYFLPLDSREEENT